MAWLHASLARSRAPLLTLLAITITVLLGGVAFTDLPQQFGWLTAAPDGVGDPADEEHGDHAGHDRAGHDHAGEDHAGHDHAGHDDTSSIEVSAQARATLQLATQTVSVGRFDQSIEVPAAVVDWPGRTHVAITSPLTGVINAIYISRGEQIESGAPLFKLRLTHQDLVETQKQFLTSLGQLDVEQREIERLTAISNSGAIAGNKRIEREYERDKLTAQLKAARQALLLHGLNESQVGRVEQTRELIREVTIFAPALHVDRSLHHDSLHDLESNATLDREPRIASLQPPSVHSEHVEAALLVTQLEVSRGEAVQAGQRLGQLSDYSEVLIEGLAYQRDREALQRAANAGEPLQAVIQTQAGPPRILEGLQIVYIGNEFDRHSRALPFFVPLQNELERSERVEGHQYISWRFKPGQRLQLRVPVASFEDAIVVPKQAVAEEGLEHFVFVENNDHFDRVPVHVLASDSVHVAIANDGQVWPGQSIAVRGAHQLQMAMKNQTGGAIGPHAGHNH